MAKFCTKCGKKIEDGKKCNCINKVSTVNKKTSDIDINEIINSLVDIAKGIFVKPIDTIRKYSSDSNMVLGFILIAINSIITCIMGYLLVKESMGALMSLFMGGYGSLYSLTGSSIDIPFFEVAGIIFLIIAVYFVVLAFASYIIANKVFKADTTWKKAVASIGVCSALTSITSIVAIICIYISMTTFMVVICLAALLFTSYYYHSIAITSDIDENKQGYTFISAMAVALFIAVYLLPKIFS